MLWSPRQTAGVIYNASILIYAIKMLVKFSIKILKTLQNTDRVTSTLKAIKTNDRKTKEIKGICKYNKAVNCD